jgi:hypothetical protein
VSHKLSNPFAKFCKSTVEVLMIGRLINFGRITKTESPNAEPAQASSSGSNSKEAELMQ